MHRQWSIWFTSPFLFSLVCYIRRSCPYFKWFFGILALKTFANKPVHSNCGWGNRNVGGCILCQVLSFRNSKRIDWGWTTFGLKPTWLMEKLTLVSHWVLGPMALLTTPKIAISACLVMLLLIGIHIIE